MYRAHKHVMCTGTHATDWANCRYTKLPILFSIWNLYLDFSAIFDDVWCNNQSTNTTQHKWLIATAQNGFKAPATICAWFRFWFFSSLLLVVYFPIQCIAIDKWNSRLVRETEGERESERCDSIISCNQAISDNYNYNSLLCWIPELTSSCAPKSYAIYLFHEHNKCIWIQRKRMHACN